MNNSKEQSILVTGGAGFIGSHLCERLIKEARRVVCLDNFNDFYDFRLKEDNLKDLMKNSNFSLIKGDILSLEELEKIFFENKISKIIHLAALPGVRTSFFSPQKYIDVDIKGTVNLLEMAKKNKISQFIFGSSSSIYGIGSKIPFREDERNMTTISPYSSSKIAGEIFCKTYSEIYKIPMTILRFFTVFGPRQRPEMAIHKFTRFIKKEKSIPVFGCGESFRDYTFVDDIIEGLIKSMEKIFDFEIFNLGNSRTIKLKEMIKILGDRLNKTPKIQEMPSRPGDVPITLANIEKAKKMLDWEPKTSFLEGIDRFIDWHNKKEDFLNKFNLDEEPKI